MLFCKAKNEKVFKTSLFIILYKRIRNPKLKLGFKLQGIELFKL